MGEDQALAQLSAILARPEYHMDQSLPWWQQLLSPVLEFVWQVASQLYQLVVASTTGREGVLGVVVSLAAVAVVAGAAVYIVRALRLSVVRETAMHTATLAQRRERSDRLWQTAQQLAAAGQLPEAVRLLYLSALYALDERALLHVEPNLTNREHAQQLLQRSPALATSFLELVNRYERVRYGRVTVHPEAFAEMSRRAAAIRSAALSPAAA